MRTWTVLTRPRGRTVDCERVSRGFFFSGIRNRTQNVRLPVRTGAYKITESELPLLSLSCGPEMWWCCPTDILMSSLPQLRGSRTPQVVEADPRLFWRAPKQ